jgi:aminoglycoside 3-N-acetyltransferase
VPQAITANHGLTSGLDETSPLAQVYERDGWVLLLGVGHRNNTSFHLGDYRAGYSPEDAIGAALLEGGQRVWKVFHDMAWDDKSFPVIGVDFEATGAATVGPVGVGRAHLFSQRLAVDFAERWLRARKRRGAHGQTP